MCLQCGQALCSECDKKIHNKGKRLEHVREGLKSGPASEKSEPKSSSVMIQEKIALETRRSHPSPQAAAVNISVTPKTNSRAIE
jgi:hypothetical protein